MIQIDRSYTQEKTREDLLHVQKVVHITCTTTLSHEELIPNSVSHIIAKDYSQHYLVHKKFSLIGKCQTNQVGDLPCIT
jgi:hypothetical protein